MPKKLIEKSFVVINGDLRLLVERGEKCMWYRPWTFVA